MIHHSLPFEIAPSTSDNVTEIQSIKCSLKNTDITIHNIYIPPCSSCPPNYEPNLNDLIHPSTGLILGDFNAHNKLWHSNIQDKRGDLIAEQINLSPYCTLNNHNQTRLPNNNSATSPDISLASADLASKSQWTTLTKLSSDHLPIIIEVAEKPLITKTIKNTFYNFRKAQLSNFTTFTEQQFSDFVINNNIHHNLSFFHQTLLKAGKKFIPAGRRHQYTPCFSKEAADLIKRRDAIRLQNPHSFRIPLLNKRINDTINKHKLERWKQHLSTFDIKTNNKKLWTTIKALNGQPQPHSANYAINFNTRPIRNNSIIAKKFNKLFANVKLHRTNRLYRTIDRKTRNHSLSNPHLLTADDVKFAIKQARPSTAIDCNDISIFHLKHIGPLGLHLLTTIFNQSLSNCIIPDCLKKSQIIPLLKPGKPMNEASSYRPISILPTTAKILEKCLLPLLRQHLPLQDHQHGFRPRRSTTTALATLTTDIINGLNQKNHPIEPSLPPSISPKLSIQSTFTRSLTTSATPPYPTTSSAGYPVT